ncbi:YPO3983 family protein [Yersinia pseudotuberculosis]
MDDYGAADMKNGDLTEAELKGKFNLRGVSVTLDPYTGEKTPTSFAMDHFNKKPKEKVNKAEVARILFDEFRHLSDTFSFSGKYQSIMRKMITHMQINNGAPFRDLLLDSALKEQILSDKSKNSSLLSIKKTLLEKIDWDNGHYPLSDKVILSEVMKDIILPRFDRSKDRINGLGIGVHAIHATHITIKSLKVDGDMFHATVHYRSQDHFGLDDTDILDSFYRQFRIFHIWFVLQRWKGLGYKPFLTNMEASIEITGKRQ